MEEIRKIVQRKKELRAEVRKLDRRLDELCNPYRALAEEFRKKLGLKYPPYISSRSAHSKTQVIVRKALDYLIKHKHTSDNPITSDDLRKALGVNYQNFYNAIRLGSMGRSYGIHWIEEFYVDGVLKGEAFEIVDMKKAKTSVKLLRKMAKLP